jgi:23S rRNA maturation mini-RNase III
MKVLRSLERDMMYVVEIVVKKGHNARSYSQPKNLNRKKYP